MSDFRVIVSPRAFLDLNAVFDHIKASSPANAVLTVDRIQSAMHALERFPHRYRVVAAKNPDEAASAGCRYRRSWCIIACSKENASCG
jgi:plasmid stabilization system protein ParE